MNVPAWRPGSTGRFSAETETADFAHVGKSVAYGVAVDLSVRMLVTPSRDSTSRRLVEPQALLLHH